MTDARIYHTTEQLAAVAAHVERNYGYGHRVGALSSSVFQVLASDGSRFRLRSDRYGQVELLCENPDPGQRSGESGETCMNAGKYRIRRGRALCDEHFAEHVDEEIRTEAQAR